MFILIDAIPATGKNPKIPKLVNTWYYRITNLKPMNSQVMKYFNWEMY